MFLKQNFILICQSYWQLNLNSLFKVLDYLPWKLDKDIFPCPFLLVICVGFWDTSVGHQFSKNLQKRGIYGSQRTEEKYLDHFCL